MFEQPGWRRSTGQDKVVPPPWLLHPLLTAVDVSHQGVALVLVIRVEAVVGFHRPVVLLLGIRNLDQDEVNPAGPANALGKAHFLHRLDVTRSRGTHHMDPWDQEAKVLTIFT